MTSAAVVILVVFALGILVRMLGLAIRSSAKEGSAFPYKRHPALFSPAERSFLGVLDQAVAGNYRVFGKVRVADVAAVRGTPNKSHWQRAFNKVSAKHFDFVLCNPADLSFVCVIELDDKSHSRDKRRGRDQFIDGVCATMELPLLRFPAKRGYILDEIREAIAQAAQRDRDTSMAASTVQIGGTSTLATRGERGA